MRFDHALRRRDELDDGATQGDEERGKLVGGDAEAAQELGRPYGIVGEDLRVAGGDGADQRAYVQARIFLAQPSSTGVELLRRCGSSPEHQLDCAVRDVVRTRCD